MHYLKKVVLKLFVLGLLLASPCMVYSQNQVVGYIYYCGDENFPMEDVDVGLYDTQDVLISSTQTDENGFYQFNEIDDGAYYLRSSTNAEARGVDITDAYYLMLYLLDLYELGPIEYLAADVDGNEQVEWLDYYIFVVNYLLNDEPFPVGDWVSEEHFLELSSRSDGDTVASFITETGQTLGGGGRSVETTQTIIEEIDVVEKRMTVDINVNDPSAISGSSITLSYPADMIMIREVTGPDENFHFSLSPDQRLLSCIWMDQDPFDQAQQAPANTLLSVVFEVIPGGVDEGRFEILEGSAFIGPDGFKAGDIEVTVPVLKRTTSAETAFRAFPNPFTDRLNLTIPSQGSGSARLQVFDLAGRKVDDQGIALHEGINTFTFNTEKYRPGHYFYVMESSDPAVGSVRGKLYKSSK